ncbi:MAG TPA: DUF4062 domain-containing protein [Longimicrobiaceae bacterium]
MSSTFTDLRDERQAVLRAILELDHMPAGMELFPAADATAWQIIKDVIDASDYYVLVVGGRYGSLDETGIGYTEKEYDYATTCGKPVVPLLHENPDNLPRERTETDQASWERLKTFREKVEKRHTCVYWKTAEDLKAKVIIGLTAAMKRSPGVGWVRADRVPTEATVTEILTLRKKVSELEAQVEEGRLHAPQGTEDLVQGDEQFEVYFGFIARTKQQSYPYQVDQGYTATIRPSWNQIFAAIAPTMINEAPDDELRASFKDFFRSRAIEAYKNDKDLKDKSLVEFRFREEEIETCIVQFRALGLIRESQRPRSVKDTRTFWTLTSYGDQIMTQLRALRRTPIELPNSREPAQPAEREPVRLPKGRRQSAKKL